jgi:hypothetical protein
MGRDTHVPWPVFSSLSCSGGPRHLWVDSQASGGDALWKMADIGRLLLEFVMRL